MLVTKRTPFTQAGARHIAVRGGKQTLVSERDFAWLNSFKWFALKSAATTYVCTRRIMNGKTYTIRMHRLIMHCPNWLKVHHVNHDSFDNRRENLQVITEREHRHFDGWHIFTVNGTSHVPQEGNG